MNDGHRNAALAKELATACMVAGLTHRQLAERVGMSTSRMSRVLNAAVPIDPDLAGSLAQACGHRLAMHITPGDGIRLRDSGQLALAEAIRREAHASWRIQFEAPIGQAPDRRAADILLRNPYEAVLLEIERWLRDYQAQYRALQLKRAAYSERTGSIVRLVMALPDTTATRRALEPHRDVIASSFTVSSRRAWACIRSGEPLGGDALLWVRG
jgi:transcriptional regulator with XRE-family HTH domain